MCGRLKSWGQLSSKLFADSSSSSRAESLRRKVPGTLAGLVFGLMAVVGVVDNVL